MVQVVWLDAGPDRPGRVLVLVHHCVVDGVSLRILRGDLAQAWAAVAAGETPQLEPVGTSFRRWSELLSRAGSDGARRSELGLWNAAASTADPLLGARALDPARDLVGGSQTLTVTLPAEQTATLLSTLPALYGATVNDVLLTALAVAVARWRTERSPCGADLSPAVLVDLEGHGREDVFDDADVARTVGWFTTLFPVRVDPGPIDPTDFARGGADVGVALRRVKEGLRAVPDRGLGYGVLRHLDPATGEELGAADVPQLLFNYLGRFAVQDGAPWTPAPDAPPLGDLRDPGMPMGHALDVDAVVRDGEDGPRLSTVFAWPSEIFGLEDIAALAELWREALGGLHAHTALPGAGGHTPSDFPYVVLDQPEIDAFEAAVPALDDVLPATALQEGLFFHALADEDAQDVYVVQHQIDLRGPLDPARLRAAVGRLLERHPPLRASFHQRADGHVVQAIAAGLEVPWREVSASSPGDADSVAREAAALPFDLGNAPLLRCTLIALGDERARLLITFHHLLADGWSEQVILRDLLAFYAPDGEAEPLPAATPYRRYFAWRAEQDRPAAADAWRAALADVEEPTRVVPATAAAGALHFEDAHAELDAALTAELGARVRERGVTLSTAVQVAWGLTLGHLTGRDDVVFGTTVSGRPPEIEGIEHVAGLFINTLPVRVNWAAHQPLADVLAEHGLRQADLLDHQHLGLAEIMRLAGGGELFDTLMVFENQPPQDVVGRVAGGVEVTAFRALDSDHYPLAFVATPGETLRLLLKFDRDRFSRADADRILGRVRALLEAVVRDPSQPAGRVDMLGGRERARLLHGWTGPRMAIAHPNVDAAFAAQAARTPDAAAVLDGDDVHSYAQLDAWADRIARRLRSAGAGPEQAVAVALPRSAGLVAALLGVLRAGAVYVPLDLSHPAARRELVLADSGARIVVAASADAEALCTGGVRALVLDDDEAPDLGAHGAPGAAAGPLNGAYCIHTSGSTGRPKGVVVSHRALLSQLTWATRALALGPDDRVLTKAPTSVDVSLLEILWPLCSGAAVVVAPGDSHRDPLALAALVREHRVTAIDFSPSMLDAFLRATEGDAGATASLRRAFSGGEALDAALAERWREQTGVPLLNAYGPTEAAIQVTCGESDRDGDCAGERTPIGRPVANTELRILDAALRPVAPRTPGELYVSGTQLARGYLGRPDLTAERFVADPFAGAPGARMYRTGDLVRDRGDGAIEFLGRADDQVKLRGNRVELGEIEARLAREDGVARAVAVVRTDGPGEARLVAYVTAADAERRPDPDVLRDALAAVLPEPLVPSAIVVLDALPLGPSGKVDRGALPAPEPDRARREAAAVRAPADDRERLLCETFAAVLGLDAVGPDEDFLVLGGDSILSISVSIAARKAGLRLSPGDVFRARTPAALAQLAPVTEPQPAEPEPAAPDAGGGSGDVLPLPVVHHLRESGGPIGRFNLSQLVQTPADARHEQIAAILQALLDRHDALRLRLQRIAEVLWTLEARPAQTVRADDLLTRVDVRGQAPETLRATITAQSDAAIARLDPDAGRMLEAVWFDAGTDAPGRLLLAAHHLAVDGVSWRILLDDLASAWKDVRAGRPPAPAPVGTSLRAFARTVDERARTPQRLAEIDLWRRTLAAGADLLPGAARDATEADAVADTIALPTDVTAPLLGAGVTERLLAALALAVARWRTARGDDEQRELLVDLERHGREPLDGADLSRTVGWFTVIHPVRLPGDTGAVTALAGITERLRAIPDNGIGYGMLRYANAQVAPLLAQSSRPQVLFNYYGRFPEAQAADWLPAPESDALDVAPDGAQGLPYLLALDVVCADEPAGPRLRATWTRTAGGLTAEDVQALQAGWIEALRELAALPAQPDAAPLLTPADVTTVALTQEQIEAVRRAAAPAEVEDIWRLSPLQEGLYFHATFDEGELDVYTAQTSLDFERGIDVERLQRAAAALLRRNASLRAGFVSDGLPQPVQVVAREPHTPIEVVDLAELDPPAQRARLHELMDADRTRRFDLAQPPLMRMLVVRLGGGTDRLVITNHLVLWDGWSQAILRDGLLALYESDGDDAGLPVPGSYRDYLAWLSARDGAAAARAWRDALAGLPEPTLVGPVDRAPAPMIPNSCRIALSSELSERLRRRAGGLGVTPNTLLTAAWGLVLSAQLGRDDVVFGMTVTDRPAEVDGVDETIGMFINTVPLRVRLDPREPVGDLLQRMQAERAMLMEHDHLGLGTIQRETGHAQLFDTLYVLQSFAGSDDEALATVRTRHGVSVVDSVDATHYPLTLVVTPGRRLRVMLDHRPDLFDREAAEALLARFETVLRQLATDGDRLVGTLDLLGAQARAELETFAGSDRRGDRRGHGRRPARRAGAPHPARGRARVRRRGADLRRARRPDPPPRAAADRPRRRPRGGRRARAAALDGDGRRAVRGALHRRRLHAARQRTSPRAPRAHARRRPAPAAALRPRPPRTRCRRRPPDPSGSCSTTGRSPPRSKRSPDASSKTTSGRRSRARCRTVSSTSPTSSTRRARRAGRRAWRRRTAG